MEVLEVAADQETDVWSRKTLETALARVSGKEQEAQEEQVKVPNWLRKRERKYYVKGHEVFNRDGYCATCHRVTGRGFTESGFPPLAGTEWVNGDKVRLVKLTLHG